MEDHDHTAKTLATFKKVLENLEIELEEIKANILKEETTK